MTKKTRKPPKQATAPKRTRAAKPANQVTPAKKSKPVPPAKPAAKTFILFGADEYAKPRAAKFAAPDPTVLAKAAGSLRVRLIEVTNPDLAEVAAKLPAGRLHASGGGLVPYIKGPLYLELIAAVLPDVDTPAGPDPTVQELPGSWDEIQPGHVVIVKETSECGWWDAVVVERNGDLVTVQYRDCPHCPSLVRHRSAVALIGKPAQ
jgi:hypothetical protein